MDCHKRSRYHRPQLHPGFHKLFDQHLSSKYLETTDSSVHRTGDGKKLFTTTRNKYVLQSFTEPNLNEEYERTY